MEYSREAQSIGVIAHEYGFSLREIGEMTPLQIGFLLAWLRWRSRR